MRQPIALVPFACYGIGDPIPATVDPAWLESKISAGLVGYTADPEPVAVAAEAAPFFPLEIIHPSFAFLEGKSENVTSQYGEDGLIRAVFDKVGIINQWCFEVGAADGLLYSNTKQWRDKGWHTILIESDPIKYEQLKQFSSPTVDCVLANVGMPDKDKETVDLDTVLHFSQAPTDLDLGVIDIDGQDYAVWESLKQHKPRVMIIEFGAWNQFDHIAAPSDRGQEASAGKQTMLTLGTAKGYAAVFCTYCNLLFVRNDCLPVETIDE